MRYTRRQIVESTAIGAAGILAYKATLRSANAFYQSPRIPLFGTTLRGVGPGGIPVAAPDSSRPPSRESPTTRSASPQYQDPGVCPSLGPTTLWGYHQAVPWGRDSASEAPGGIIVAQKVSRSRSRSTTSFVTKRAHPPVERYPSGREPGAEPDSGAHPRRPRPLDQRRRAFRLVGAQREPRPELPEQPGPQSNGPEERGRVLLPQQPERTVLWYHDHAFGITRINAYAGIASAYIIRDNFERASCNHGLPDFIEAGGNEIPLVIQDKVFVGATSPRIRTG